MLYNFFNLALESVEQFAFKLFLKVLIQELFENQSCEFNFQFCKFYSNLKDDMVLKTKLRFLNFAANSILCNYLINLFIKLK